MKTLLTTLAAITICLVTPSLCHAQWKGDGTQRWESSVPYEPLTSLPEYHTDMPLDCMVAYIVMDSVARSMSDYSYIRDFPRKTSLDTLKVLARFFYALYDYDPILVERYIRHTNEKVRDSVNSFATYPVHLLTGFELATRSVHRLGQDYSMLIKSDLIVRAQVVDIRRGVDVTYLDSPSDWVNVACEVLDTIKGKRLPNTCVEGFRPAESGHQTQEVAPWQTGHCLIYGHNTNLPAGELLTGVHGSPNKVIQPEIGDIVYLFLSVGHEFNTITIRPQNAYDITGGVFVIKNGKVQDVGNLWGLGTTPDEESFRSNLDQKIDEIKSWWIH